MGKQGASFGVARIFLSGCLLVLAGCDEAPDTTAQVEPPSVVVAAAFNKEIRDTASFVGQIEAVDDVTLVARVSGFLEETLVQDGAFVEEGTQIFRIEKASYAAALSAAKADLAKAKADTALRRADLERDRDLFSKGHISQAKFDSSQAVMEQSAANEEAARAAVNKAELDLGYTDIKAPFSGRIGKTTFSDGEVVGPSSGALARLTRLAPVYVGFSIAEKELVAALRRTGGSLRDMREQKNKPAIYLDLPDGERFGEVGEIVFVDNRVDAATGTIAMRGLFKNEELGLVPGTYVTVVLEGAAAETRLLVPQAAVQRDQRGAFVLAINDKQLVEPRYIKTGAEVDGTLVVLEGLQEGESVIVQGLQKVRPGVPVNAVLAGQPAE